MSNSGPYISSTQVAASVPFDNTTNGFIATDTQAAIEESKSLPITQIIWVAKNGSDSTGAIGDMAKPFLTVVAALAAITDNSVTKRYEIQVATGVYIENNPIVAKPYVGIMGMSAAAKGTTIAAANANQHLFNTTNAFSFANISLTGVTGTGYALINQTSTTISNTYVRAHNVFLNSSDILVKCTGGAFETSMVFANCVIGHDSTFTQGFVCDGAGATILPKITVAELYCNDLDSAAYPASIFYAKNNGIITVSSSIVNAGEGLLSTGIAGQVDSGGRLEVISTKIQNFAVALQTNNVGAAPELNGSGVFIVNCTADLNILHVSTTGNYIGIATRTKSVNNAPNSIQLAYQDPLDGNYNVTRTSNMHGFATDVTSVVTAAQTTQILSTDSYALILTGSTAGQILKLPNATTVRTGHQYWIMNESSVPVTVQDFAGLNPLILPANTNVHKILKDNSTSAGLWNDSLGANYLAGKLRDPRQFSMNGTVGNGNWITVSELIPSYKYIFTESVKMLGIEWSNGNGNNRDFDLVFYKNGTAAGNIIRTYQVRASTNDYGSATGWTDSFVAGDYMRVLYVDQGNNVADFGGRFNFEVI